MYLVHKGQIWGNASFYEVVVLELSVSLWYLVGVYRFLYLFKSSLVAVKPEMMPINSVQHVLQRSRQTVLGKKVSEGMYR